MVTKIQNARLPTPMATSNNICFFHDKINGDKIGDDRS